MAIHPQSQLSSYRLATATCNNNVTSRVFTMKKANIILILYQGLVLLNLAVTYDHFCSASVSSCQLESQLQLELLCLS